MATVKQIYCSKPMSFVTALSVADANVDQEEGKIS